MFYNLTDNKRLVLCAVCKILVRRDGCVAGSRHLIFPTRVGSLYAFAPRGQRRTLGSGVCPAVRQQNLFGFTLVKLLSREELEQGLVALPQSDIKKIALPG